MRGALSYGRRKPNSFGLSCEGARCAERSLAADVSRVNSSAAARVQDARSALLRQTGAVKCGSRCVAICVEVEPFLHKEYTDWYYILCSIVS